MPTPRKVLVRISAVAGIVALGTAIAAFQGIVPRGYAGAAMALFFGTLLGVAAMAWQDRATLLARREELGRTQALVMLAAQLREESVETLEELARQGGLPGEAATLLLQGRAERARRRSESTG